jgi:hypothetical protein
VEGRSFRCPAAGCDKSYPERSSLMRHIRTHLRAGGRGGKGGSGGALGSSRGRGDGSSDSEVETRRRRGEMAANTGPPFKV